MIREGTDIGHGVTIRFVRWAPDRELNPQYADVPDVDRYGLIETHQRPDNGEPCEGYLTLDSEVSRKLDPDRPRWTVETWEPLTLSPSVLCTDCGQHGFIRDGRWVPA